MRFIIPLFFLLLLLSGVINTWIHNSIATKLFPSLPLCFIEYVRFNVILLLLLFQGKVTTELRCGGRIFFSQIRLASSRLNGPSFSRPAFLVNLAARRLFVLSNTAPQIHGTDFIDSVLLIRSCLADKLIKCRLKPMCCAAGNCLSDLYRYGNLEVTNSDSVLAANVVRTSNMK